VTQFHKTFCFPLALPVMAVNKARKSFKVSQCSAIMCVFSHRMNSAYSTYMCQMKLRTRVFEFIHINAVAQSLQLHSICNCHSVMTLCLLHCLSLINVTHKVNSNGEIEIYCTAKVTLDYYFHMLKVHSRNEELWHVFSVTNAMVPHLIPNGLFYLLNSM
jgi:hypothetical protein